MPPALATPVYVTQDRRIMLEGAGLGREKIATDEHTSLLGAAGRRLWK